MSPLPFIFIFVFGLLVGSFLNLVIDRVPREEQIFRGRSKCDFCGRTLAWYDLIPLVSWFSLRGRCRYCHSPIPSRNVIVEMITGTLFILVTLSFMDKNYGLRITDYGLADFTSILRIIKVLSILLILSSLIAIFFIDLEHKIIPDKIIYPAIFLILMYNLIFNFSPPAGGLIFNLASALGAAGFFLFLVLITRGKGMGIGDVKLAALMGLFLGFPKIIYALYFAFLTGALISVMLILLGKKKFGQTIAFGPFLVVGTLLSYFNVLNLIGGKIW